MDLYQLGMVPWQQTQLAYHALAYLGREGLILCCPAEPYVCLGYSQDPSQEIDLDYCQERGLPLFRREVGGGAVYLDRGQIFWQVVLPQGHPLLPARRDVFYRRFLEPVAATYRALGVEADIEPSNELRVGTCKIAGTGAGEIGDCVAFVGNIMRSFDCAVMARVAAAPTAEFRRLYLHSMEGNLTSLRRELGREQEAVTSNRRIFGLLAEQFAKVMGPLQIRPLDSELSRAMERLGRRMLSPAWTQNTRRPKRYHKIKVRAGLFLHHWRGQLLEKGLEAHYTSQDGKVVKFCLEGDFNGLKNIETRMNQEFLGGDVRSLQKYLSLIPQVSESLIAPA